MSNLWRTAAVQHPLYYAQQWADEYPLSPVAHPEVVSLIRSFPPIGHTWGSISQAHDKYGRIMNNVVHHHATEWFKGDNEDGDHETTHHLTQHYLDAHNGTSEIADLL